jgi:hypothetical protein
MKQAASPLPDLPAKPLTAAESCVRWMGAECERASAAFSRYDAKYAAGGAPLLRSENLKPNIYYKAQELSLRPDRAPGRRAAGRVGFHLYGTAGDEDKFGRLSVNGQHGVTEARARVSFDGCGAKLAEDASCEC